MNNNKFKTLAIIFVIFVVGLVAGLGFSKYKPEFFFKQNNQSSNIHLAFVQEVREIILENYWDTLSQEIFVQLHVKAIEQLIAQPLGDRIKNYQDLDQEIEKILSQYPDESAKEEFVVQLADLVLANLEPFGRSRLYSKQLKQELVEKVSNIDPNADHYQSLGIEPNASKEDLEQAYQQQKTELEQQTDAESQQKLAQLEAAHQTLSEPATRAHYDEAGVNPTMQWQLLSPEIFYLKIKQFSPTTVEELHEVTQKVDDRDDQLASLILDLRGNIGGALDGLPYFLGPFIGNNQYTYQLIQQGKTTDFKTRTGWLPGLVRYKKMVILIDQEVQSSAEILADVLQRYNVGVLVGSTTKGWGTVERVFPISNQLNQDEEYSLFLVHHLTLRSDGTSIEGNGIIPDVIVTHSNWQVQLLKYFSDQSLVEAVEKLIAE